MRITLKLFAGLRSNLPESSLGGPAAIDLAPSATVGDALDKVGAKREQAKIILVNSRHAGLETPLADGDTVAVFPPVGGG
jgi:molybdopterin converting factor small subunit